MVLNLINIFLSWFHLLPWSYFLCGILWSHRVVVRWCMRLYCCIFFIVRTEHSRSFAISYGVFASMLLLPQWITTCLIVGENSRFSARHGRFSTLSHRIPQFKVFFSKNEFHTFVYLESPWINESPSNTVRIFLFAFDTDIC